MLAFRDGVQRLSRERFDRELSELLRAARSSAAARLALLLRAGELESALEDSGHAAAVRARQLSDDAAQAFHTNSASPLAVWPCSRPLARLGAELPSELHLKRPEGYAYYALQPTTYAQALGPRHAAAGAVAVVGVRSIGTSLSALVLAALRERAVQGERITVRPTGHPWERRLQPKGAFEAFVRRRQSALYLVVDEGPGLSGSTFLAVAEALERCGIARERIELLCSHDPDPARLVAADGRRRWQRYRSIAPPDPPQPAQALELSAGAWRSLVYSSRREWPACNTALERRKYRHPSGILLKFIGLPPYGEAPLARGQRVAAAGFGPELIGQVDGYVAQRWIEGRPLRLPLHDPRHLQRLLDYLVFRSQQCRSEEGSVTPVQDMLRVNVAEALGWELPRSLQLQLERPVYADARLSPHEWIEGADGSILKVDASDHGDDHSLPGPCDSAWDIAGAILEWRLSPARTRELCGEYRRRTRDNVVPRLGAYLLAYAALGLGRAQLALLSAAADERPRLARASQAYAVALRRLATINGWQGRSCASSTCC